MLSKYFISNRGKIIIFFIKVGACLQGQTCLLSGYLTPLPVVHELGVSRGELQTEQKRG